MASVFVDQRSASSSADEPIEHEDLVDGDVYAVETNAEVKSRPTLASFHKHTKKTQEVFEDLKNAVVSSIAVFENSLALLNAREERLITLSSRISSINFESAIKLNVGGNIYQTSLETLTKHPGSLLADMFSGCFNLKLGDDGCYFIDRDGTHFRYILNYLRSGTVPLPSILKTESEEILHEAEYYGLVGLVKAINIKLNGDDDSSSENIMEENQNAGSEAVNEARNELCATEKKLISFLNLLDANLKFLDEATTHHEKMSMKLSNVHFGENVKIDIGGRIFRTSLKTLRRESESFLASMFSEKFDLKKEDDGSFFIDRDGSLFHHILNYLRDCQISEDVIEAYGPHMQREAEFYGLSGLKEQICNYNHVKLNVGGREFVVNRAVLKKYPDSMFGRILAGEECAFERSQDGSYCIDRDGANFNHILGFLRFGHISCDVIEKCGESLSGDAVFYMLPRLEEQIQNYHNIKVEVGGREFVLSRNMLNEFPESMFGKMLSGGESGYVKRSDGSYSIQRDSKNFHHIQNYLRSGTVSDDVIGKHSESLLSDADFYMLPDLAERINDYHNVKMNIGGRKFVVSRRLLNKFPDSMFGRMLAGEEGDYVKKDDRSYFINRDGSRFHHIVDYLKFGTLSDNIIEKYGGTSLLSPCLFSDADFYVLPGLAERIHDYYNVQMTIGDKEFVVGRKVLGKFPESMFGKMLAGMEGGYVRRIDGSYVIQHDGTNFYHILTYLRSGTLSDGVIEKHGAFLLDDAEFYILSGLKERINNYYNVKMIIGTREFVVSRKVLGKFPESLFGKMLAGEKGDYIKINDGSYYILRDGDRFPYILRFLNGDMNEVHVDIELARYLHEDASFYGLSDFSRLVVKNLPRRIGKRFTVVRASRLDEF